ncbi:MAG: hypothetical protein GY820_48230, partial [Gammaproteobacteria bacterium]|nr:hypothetical protein [Gammaproteobacteria bacterium]
MKVSNMYTLTFAHPPGKMVTDYMHNRSKYLDGVRDLEDMFKLAQDNRIVSLHFEAYHGPVGSEIYEDARLLHALEPKLEERLRGENWAIPANLEKPMAVVMVIQAFRGPPVLFKLSDFARADPETGKYRMMFPPGVYGFLLNCDVVLLYNQTAVYNLLVDTYGKQDFFPGCIGPLDKVKILDLAKLNSISNIGDRFEKTPLKELHQNPLTTPRHLLRDIAHHITNDPQRFLTDDVLKRRMMNIGERKMMAVGVLHHGPTHASAMRDDQTVLTYITGHTQAMWLYLLAECVYHPGVLHRLFDAVNRVQPLQKAPVPYANIPESNSYGCLLKTAVDPIFRAMAEFDARCEFITTPQMVGQHHFQTRMHELLPGMLDVLDPFFLELRAYLWLRALTDRNTT